MSRVFRISKFTILFAVLTFPLVAVANEIRFSHQIQLHPVPPLPANITFVPDGQFSDLVEQVRALLIIDGELFAINLTKDRLKGENSKLSGSEFRGILPTPRESLTYRFQVLYKGGKAELTDNFEINPGCPGHNFVEESDREVKFLLLAQQQKKRLETAREKLTAVINQLEK